MLGSFNPQSTEAERNAGQRSTEFWRKTLTLIDELIKAIKEARESPPVIILPLVYQRKLKEYKELCEEMRQSEHEKTHALAVEMLNDWDAIFVILKHPTYR